jgi:hypothetical protein
MDDPDAFVTEYLDFYEQTQGMPPEWLASFGDSYHEQGYLTREQLYEIAHESSSRSAYHVRNNPADRCREVTRDVRAVDGDFSKIQLLCGLSGFKTATASCVLAALDGSRHAVVDTRVWASLERFGYLESRKDRFDASDYRRMIDPIREIATESGYTPVDVGFALFAHDADVREGTLH